jgi:hypothetical protein
METENTIIDEAENWNSGQKSFGYKQIILNHVQRVVILSSKEMKEGFWIYKDLPNQEPIRTKYVGDSRKELTQAIDTLYDLLLSKFDDTIKKTSKTIYESIDNLFKNRALQYKEFLAKNKEFDKDSYDKSDFYWKERLSLYRQLFQEICLFLERIGWLDAGDVED